MDDERASLLQSKLFTPMEICSVLEKVFMAVGAGILLIVIVIILKNCAHHQALVRRGRVVRASCECVSCKCVFACEL